MKWPKRTAQGLALGLPWKKFDLKVSTELGRVASGVYYVVFNGLIRVEPSQVRRHQSLLTSHLK